ncbi:hypothetical protein M426DRAFT_189784 [Hypoxylon sp. CI-4A]|nr:hypothetical protein M426DRAFT_189784 [Hypoxylon sp. CI-4A]
MRCLVVCTWLWGFGFEFTSTVPIYVHMRCESCCSETRPETSVPTSRNDRSRFDGVFLHCQITAYVGTILWPAGNRKARTVGGKPGHVGILCAAIGGSLNL